MTITGQAIGITGQIVSNVQLTTGHVFQLFGIFLAFLATGFSFLYANLIKGGVVGRASLYNSLGFMILAIDIFLIYAASITGQLDLLNVTIFWPLLGLLTTIGFGVIAFAQYKLWRATSR